MNESKRQPSPLFAGIDAADQAAMLPCLGAIEKRFAKGSRILCAGQTTERLGVIVEGRAHVEVCDAWGNIAILEALWPGDIFAHGYACCGEPLDIDVTADSDCTVLMLKVERIMHPCPRQCGFHAQAATNLMRQLSLRNLALNRRAVATAPKTIRGKLLAYLSQQRKAAGSARFTIPYSQTKLANYLGVDRSALSTELAKLRREGVIDYKGSTFAIL